MATKRQLDSAQEEAASPRKLEPIPEDPSIVRLIGLSEDATPYTWNIPFGLLNKEEQDLCLEMSNNCDEDPQCPYAKVKNLHHICLKNTKHSPIYRNSQNWHPLKKQSPIYTFVDHESEEPTTKALYKLGIRLGINFWDHSTRAKRPKEAMDLKYAALQKAAGRPIRAIVIASLYY